jgi:hypothetical protein
MPKESRKFDSESSSLSTAAVAENSEKGAKFIIALHEYDFVFLRILMFMTHTLSFPVTLSFNPQNPISNSSN